MDIKILIKKYHIRQKRAAHLFEQYRKLKDRALSPKSTANFTEIKTKNNGEQDTLYIKIITAWENWQIAQLDYIEARQELFDIILQMENPDESDILYFRFIEGMKHHEIVEIWPEEHRGEILTEDAEMTKSSRGYKHLQELARKL